MADDLKATSTSEHVFDFSFIDFTREELISTLHDMVNEYKKLAQFFKEAKAKKNDSKATETNEKSSVDVLKFLSLRPRKQRYKQRMIS